MTTYKLLYSLLYNTEIYLDKCPDYIGADSHLGTSPTIFRHCTVNCIITFLLYMQLFKENATFKLQFALIVLPC